MKKYFEIGKRNNCIFNLLIELSNMSVVRCAYRDTFLYIDLCNGIVDWLKKSKLQECPISPHVPFLPGLPFIMRLKDQFQILSKYCTIPLRSNPMP